MEFGTNSTTYYVILPILVVVIALIVWVIIKARVSTWQRVGLAIGGVFAFFGFAMALLCVYYHTNSAFAGSFKYYAYSALAPDTRNPFVDHSDGQSVLMLRAVGYVDGQVKMLYHPNPNYPTLTHLFVPSKMIVADLYNDVLTIPNDDLKRTEQTSLWWALTKDLYTQNISVQ